MILAGGMAERSKAAVLKTARVQALVGSNPTPSARFSIHIGLEYMAEHAS